MPLKLAGNRPRRCLIASRRTCLEFGPQIGRDFYRQIAHPVRQAALTRRTREALLDGTDDAGRSVADDQQGVSEPARAHVLEECPHRLDVLLRAGHKVEQNLAAVLADAPGGHHCLTRLAST